MPLYLWGGRREGGNIAREVKGGELAGWREIVYSRKEELRKKEKGKD